MKDPVVLQQLQMRGIEPDDRMLQRYDAMERRARILDKPPSKIKLARISNPTECGIAAQFRDTYNEFYGTVESNLFYIDVAGQRTIYLDEKVFYTLRTLLLQNMNVNEEVTQACSTLFQKIALCGGNEGKEVVTEMRMHEVLRQQNPQTYAEKVLIRTIMEVCYGDDQVALTWRQIAHSDGYYQYAITCGEIYIRENDLTEKQLKQLISENYKLAKADNSFMMRLMKGIPTKALIAMMYKLKEDEKIFTANVEDLDFM